MDRVEVPTTEILIRPLIIEMVETIVIINLKSIKENKDKKNLLSEIKMPAIVL